MTEELWLIALKCVAPLNAWVVIIGGTSTSKLDFIKKRSNRKVQPSVANSVSHKNTWVVLILIILCQSI